MGSSHTLAFVLISSGYTSFVVVRAFYQHLTLVGLLSHLAHFRTLCFILLCVSRYIPSYTLRFGTIPRFSICLHVWRLGQPFVNSDCETQYIRPENTRIFVNICVCIRIYVIRSGATFKVMFERHTRNNIANGAFHKH